MEPSPSSFLPSLTLGMWAASPAGVCVCATCARREGPGKQGTVSRGGLALSPGGQDCRGGLKEPLPFGVSRASGQLPEGNKAGAQTTRGGRRLGSSPRGPRGTPFPLTASGHEASGWEAGRPATPAAQT